MGTQGSAVSEGETGVNRRWRVMGARGSAVSERGAGVSRGWRVMGTRGSLYRRLRPA